MKATQLLHDEGQSLWLDDITRDLPDRGTLKQYVSWTNLMAAISSGSASLKKSGILMATS